VERQDDPGDRRAKRIVLTAAAGPVVRAASEAATEVRGQALEGLSPEALAAAEAVLEGILARLSTPAEVGA
jgi:DNA-binding MarR family transcriptional regulator